MVYHLGAEGCVEEDDTLPGYLGGAKAMKDKIEGDRDRDGLEGARSVLVSQSLPYYHPIA